MATGDFLLQIDGIQGEEKRKEAIHVLGFSWGGHAPFDVQTTSRTGKTQFFDLKLTTVVGRHSPTVAKFMSVNQVFNAALILSKPAGNRGQIEYVRIALTKARVSDYKLSGIEGATQLPTEEIGLRYARINFKYAAQESDGGKAGDIIFDHDLWDNK